jgi:hypothetical protein
MSKILCQTPFKLRDINALFAVEKYSYKSQACKSLKVIANLEMKFGINEARIVLATEVAPCQARRVVASFLI